MRRSTCKTSISAGYKQRAQPANFHELPVFVFCGENRLARGSQFLFDIIVRAALLCTGRPQSYAEVVMQENERTKMLDRSTERLGEMRRYL